MERKRAIKPRSLWIRISFFRDFLRSIIAVVSLASLNLKKNKRRSLNLLLGFIIASSLLTSLLVWNETSTKLAILDSFERKDFELIVEPKPGLYQTHILDQVEGWLANQTIIEKSFQVYQSPAIFGSESFNDIVKFEDNSIQQQILITSAETLFYLENDFLQAIRDQFIVEGKFELSKGDMIISRTLYQTLQEELNFTLTIDSTLSFSAITAQKTTFDEYLANLTRFHFSDYKIVGIYDRIPRKSLTELSFNPETLGEGIFLRREAINANIEAVNASVEDQLEKNNYRPKLFARVSRKYVSKLSFSSVETAIESLEAQIRSKFPQTFVKLEIDDIRTILSQYSASFTYTFFMALPLIILSAFLINFAARMVFQDRRIEIGLLRARGASIFQLMAVLFLEFLFITLFGVTIGVALGIGFAAMIPASDSFLSVNLSLFLDQLTQVSVSLLELWVVSGAFCIFLATFSCFWQISEFLSSEISDTMGSRRVRFGRVRSLFRLESPLAFSAAFASLTVLFIIFIIIILRKALVSIYGNSTWMLAMFLGAIFFWIAYGKAFSRLMGSILPGTSQRFRRFLGPQVLLVSKSLKRRANQVIPLIMILVLAFGIGTFAVVNSETIKVNTDNQVDYVIGADFKIRTRAVPSTFADNLRNINGIRDISHIYSTYGYVGQYSISVLGIQPGALKAIAFWDRTTFTTAKAEYVMDQLLFNPNGIIINEFLADYLQVDIGDQITLFELDGRIDPSATRNFTIIAKAHSFPAFGLADDFKGENPAIGPNGGLVILNEGFLANLLNKETTSLFLARAEKEADHQAIINALREFSEVIHVFSPDQADKDELGFFSLVGTSGLATIIFILAALISIASLTAFLSYMIRQRQTEYAIMRSTGATQKQVVLLVVEEFIGTIIFTFFAGAFLGLIFSFLYLNIGDSLVTFAGILPMEVVLPMEFVFASLSTVVLAVLIGGLIPARKAGATEVALVLRNL
ncbi:MAG: ABC transporter permease [Candidatus Thorarchaeota archaeon]